MTTTANKSSKKTVESLSQRDFEHILVNNYNTKDRLHKRKVLEEELKLTLYYYDDKHIATYISKKRYFFLDNDFE